MKPELKLLSIESKPFVLRPNHAPVTWKLKDSGWRPDASRHWRMTRGQLFEWARWNQESKLSKPMPWPMVRMIGIGFLLCLIIVTIF